MWRGIKKTLINKLRGCASWSASSLGSHFIFLVLLCCSSFERHNITKYPKDTQYPEPATCKYLFRKNGHISHDMRKPVFFSYANNKGADQAIFKKLFVCYTPTLYFFGWVGRQGKDFFSAYLFFLSLLHNGNIVIFWWKLGKFLFYFPEVPKKLLGRGLIVGRLGYSKQ